MGSGGRASRGEGGGGVAAARALAAALAAAVVGCAETCGRSPLVAFIIFAGHPRGLPWELGCFKAGIEINLRVTDHLERIQ